MYQQVIAQEPLTEEHVHRARENLEGSQVEHGMHELTKHGHLALVAMLRRDKEKASPFTAGMNPTTFEQSTFDSRVEDLTEFRSFTNK